ncbi:dTDP-4-dehydrorhamnose reductase family protein [Paenibacillus pinistramenti]|uniref:dTDP-4-dehydrorhamnose reductase family protein n=1 Tax=Paenibacillus pinistramenti TaxID=1768003 RepID=UPI0011098D4C|nr:SDR family oxidoreductase [Paenibacillus pinistramenti]
MTILVLGGQGMAGHVITGYLRSGTAAEVWCTVRRLADDSGAGSGDAQTLELDVMDEQQLRQILLQVKPQVVINAVGLLNEEADRRQLNAIYVNSFLPHRLVQLGNELGFRLIHISTDCVFSGRRGGYTEQDVADGYTLYARTKRLGEVHQDPHLTIRTSIIGPELKPGGIGLFHWFMQQQGEIRGYERVYWSGVTTLELAKAIGWVLGQEQLSGLVHLTSPHKISKFDLLTLIQSIFSCPNVTIVPYDGLSSDKSLVNTRSDFTYPVPAYAEMLQEMRAWIYEHSSDYTLYKISWQEGGASM